MDGRGRFSFSAALLPLGSGLRARPAFLCPQLYIFDCQRNRSGNWRLREGITHRIEEISNRLRGVTFAHYQGVKP